MNKYIKQRLDGLLSTLNSNYSSTLLSTSAGKGAGRANFVQLFLEETLPKNLRISTSGEMTDVDGNITGELDIVIENGMFPTWPLIGVNTTRLFIPESVAAIIEVKSNLCNQWDQVLSTAEKVNKINRSFSDGISQQGTKFILHGADFSKNGIPSKKGVPLSKFYKKVPFFVVGYTGWESLETIREKINSESTIDGVLQLDKGFFMSSDFGLSVGGSSLSLYAFIECIQKAATVISIAKANSLKYVNDNPSNPT